ncbi:MAG: ribbon-helix-helix protein, CopG family [Planctomycetota bacterium]|jgi:metal-responsive CopG/Arc/MetJ family transcriptional regulator
MKTAISIPDDLFDAADRLARRLDMSRSELYQRAVQAFLNEHDQDAVTETLNHVHTKSETGRVDHVVKQLRNVWLDVEEW